MLAEPMRTFYQYNAWANTRVLDTAALLNQEQFLAGGGASFESVRDTLVHTMSAQWIYLKRWQGISPRAMLAAQLFPDLAAVRLRWAEIAAETAAFVSQLDDEELLTTIEYTNMQGESWAYPLWQQMIHQVNHATQHRSETAILLTQFGHSPGWLDFLYFIDLQQAGTL